MAEVNDKLKAETDQSSRLRKQLSEITVLLSTKEQSLNEKINSLESLKGSLELEVAQMRISLEKEENDKHQIVAMKSEVESKMMSLQQELEKSRERENKGLEENKSVLDKLVQSEKTATSLELKLKALSAKYEQEVKAMHTEMERKSPSIDKEDQVKGRILRQASHVLNNFVFYMMISICYS